LVTIAIAVILVMTVALHIRDYSSPCLFITLMRFYS
jgi:hypothetical protein